MKKIYYAIAAALVLAGCAKETEIEEPINTNPEGRLVTIRANVGDDETRMSTDNSGNFSWQDGDKITVLTSNGNKVEFTTHSAGASVDFSGTLPSGDNLGSYALYPASTAHALNNSSSLTFSIVNDVNWSADTNNMPMIGLIDSEGNASFKAIGGVMKLILYNIPNDAREFTFAATNKKISGDFSIDPTVAAPEITLSSAETVAEKKQTIKFERTPNKVFYVPLPTGTLDGFTITLYDGDANELLSKTVTANVTVGRNKLILAPALNCAAATTIWKETFTGHSSISSNSSSPTSIQTGTGYDAVGDSGITYVLGSESSVQTSNLYSGGASSPELLVKSSNPFTVSNIPAGGNTSLELSWYSNRTTLSVTASSSDVTVGEISHNDKKHTTTLSIKNSPTTFNLTFSASENTRLDDIVLAIPAKAYSVPTITSDDDELTIGLGETSASTDVALANPVDGLGISWSVSYPVAAEEVDAYKWISAVTIKEGVLTVTASGANVTGADKTATLTLKATGAAAKDIALTLTSALVPNPTDLKALAGDQQVEISWTADEHATGYVAYYRSADGAAFDSEGEPNDGTTAITGFTVAEGKYSKTVTGLTNDTEYTLYVKVSTVADGGYVAPSAYVTTTFTPAEAKGTSENPYWASELYDILHTYKKGEGLDGDTYVKGYVVNASAPSSNSQTYFISSDGSTTKKLQIYKGKGLSGANITSSNRVNDGDWVVVSGSAINYGNDYEDGTPELNSGSSIITYHPKLSAPTFTVEEGTYYSAQSVAIDGPAGATIYYTTNGSTPTVGAEGTSVYSAAINVAANMTIKAIAVKADCVDSDVATAEYTIAAPTKLSAPTVTVSSYNHNSITFSWDAVEHASGYAISTDGGDSYGEPQDGTSYIWSGLSAATSYTIKVKAIGTANNQYTDSDPASCSQTTAAALTLSSIAVTTNPTKMAYSIGESFSITGAVVTATYSDNSTANVTTSCTNNAPATFTSNGFQTVTISYTESGTTKTCDLSVFVGVIDTLDPTFVGKPSSYTSWTGKTGTSGAVYAGNSTGGDSKIQIRGSDNSGIVTTSTGGYARTVSVAWNSSTTTTRYVDVYGKTSAYSSAADLYSTNETTKGSLIGTITFDSTTASNTTTSITIESTDYDFIGLRSRSGALYLDEIKIGWEPISWSLKSIAVKTSPTKVTYEAGEYFDPTGLVLTATYEADGHADKTVDVAYGSGNASEFTFSPTTSTALTTGNTSVSITWGGQSTSQAITVNPAVSWSLKSIAVKTAPTKVTYTVGQYFDPAGLVLTATYEATGQSDKTEDVTYGNGNASEFTFNPTTSTALQTTDTSVSITWGGKSTSQEITVSSGSQQTQDYTVTWTAAAAANLGSTISAVNGTASGNITVAATGGTPSYSVGYTRTLISGSDYMGYGAAYGIQLGKDGGVENIEFRTSNIPGTIKSVTLNCSSYQSKHKVTITVGGNTYKSATATAGGRSPADITGTGDKSGEIVISVTDGTRYVCIKSITIVYNN